MSTTAGSPPQDRLPQDSAAQAPRSRRRLILMGLGLVVIVVGGIWLARWWTVGRFIESTDDAYLQADSVTVAPKVSGYVTDVYVGDNATVKAGDPLVRLDTRQYQASLEQAEATIAARTADIQKAQADILQQHANIDQAKAQEQVARFSAQHARDEVQRYAPLTATGAETRERLAQLTNTRDQANATLAANTAAVKSAETQIASTTAQIAQARAQLEAAQASAKQSQLDMQDTIVRSALPGKVGDRSVRVGQYVQPGTRMMSVVPVQSTYLVANFKETQVGHMRIGQPVTLHVDALSGTDLHGVVDSFAPGTGAQFALLPPENATGNFTKIVQRVPVRIRINTGPETRSVLLPGLSVTADVDTRSSREGDKRIEAENDHG
ncbi:multidrug ABC transporter permease [Burkholderia sp. PAMC 28687]|jgi:membrane fusion protein (multidrug efflux system)|uniref:Membrane fusion component of tripartite multidrug resistance system n=2 Tax=Caballeronia sordidicola TaxID=196367 RepID=A0A242N987_CABSO|nr:multidrug ABC transporter permease [Burkholderia sp. PAMC 26561]AMM15794.1 multidrug ABC transporter permease [Burkholderia sp. PAMC 28687]OTP80229.1 Membrane fusion component of tripartite multidrug resistance system [Caballeronia sordidicola]